MIAGKMHQKIRWVIPALSLSMATIVFLLYSSDAPVLLPVSPVPLVGEPVSEGFLVHTSGCRIPRMDPFDRAIQKYIKKPGPVTCSSSGPITLANQTSIWIDSVAVLARNISLEELSCCTQAIWRKATSIRNKNVNADSNIVGWVDCKKFEGSVNVQDEFIKVLCYVNETEVYKDFHAFIVPKTVSDEVEKNDALKEKPSVLLIGIDAVSRLNFYRQMPKTLKYLQSKDAIELQGYNKVDDNTFPNLIPLLTGQSVDELRKTCWKHDDDVFDDCNFIWKKYHKKGYKTGFGEDACWMGVFQYLKSGFFKQPVDYYLHTFMTRAESDIGHNKKMNAKLCVGDKFAAEYLFEYAEKFAINLTKSNQNFFGLFWGTSLTHDFLNVIPQTDDIYETLLRNLDKNGVLNNTLVIVLSDHGIRWGPIRETYQGRVEERLPLVYFLVPDWLRNNYPSAISNLRRNTKMLTSPYDIHETLLDIMDMVSLSQSKLNQRIRLTTSPQRGISLFLPVPESRTCESAGVTDNWCTCHQSQNISLENPIVGRAAESVVEFLNHKLFIYIQCAQLSLEKIISAHLEAPSTKVQSSSKQAIQDVTILIVTSPGLAKFEATVRHYIGKDKMNVLGYVSRINTYGEQSKCVSDFHMRLYCFCK